MTSLLTQDHTVSSTEEVSSTNDHDVKTTLRVLRTLGEGAFGEVKLVVDARNPRSAVAMKCIDLVRHTDALSTVRKEALLQRMARGHRNVIQYIGMRMEGTEEFQLFLEYADGGELFDQIEPDVGMPLGMAQFYFRQLIEGVRYIHSKGISHRDIKPENILLTQNNVLKISDFGMATIFRHEGRERMLSTCCGTLPYASPQVIRGYYRGEATDVWACGIVLVAMLAGELPWESASMKNEAFRDWVDGTKLSENPWKKIENAALSLLRAILNDDEVNRATMDRIQSHPWYTHDVAKGRAGGAYEGRLGIRNRIEGEESSESCGGGPAKKRRCEANLLCVPSDSVSQPNARLNHSPRDELHNIKRNDFDVSLLSTSFSQPENVEDLLLNHSQIDSTLQSSIDPLQLLVRRMTRFGVMVGVGDALREIVAACEGCGYEVKTRTPKQLSITDRRDMCFVVTIYEMTKIKTVMVDFRRSRGDGLDFKRAFLRVKERLSSIICKRSTDWLENQGLVCSQAMNTLSVSD